MNRAQRYVERARVFVRDYTRGLSLEEMRRLFDREAVQAYSVLSRDQDDTPEAADKVRNFLYKTKVVFLGLSYKLTPARRMLFALSLVFVAIGLFSPPALNLSGDHADLYIDFSPVWFLLSIGCLLFLLAMELVDRIRVRDELEVARELQSELLPDDLLDHPGYRFSHAYRTANEVGGDYYDVLPLADGRLALFVGDASGHGMAAGLLMAVASASLKTALDLDPAPGQVATLLNRTLHRTGDRRSFMTFFYALLEPRTGTLDYVCAGHPFPLLRRSHGEVLELGQGGLPAGTRSEITYPEGSTTLEGGDILLLFSDGLPEAVGGGGEEPEAFGYRRLRELMARPGSPQVHLQRILRAFEDHVGEEPLRDDLTLLLVERQEAEVVPPAPATPPPPPPPPPPNR